MEYRRICNVCGNIYCFTDADIEKTDDDPPKSAEESSEQITHAIPPEIL